MLELNGTDDIRPINNCVALKDNECFKNSCPLWENEICTIELVGKALGEVFPKLELLLNFYQSLTNDEKLSEVKRFLGKALEK